MRDRRLIWRNRLSSSRYSVSVGCATPEIDEPELHVNTFAAGAGEEFRAQIERHRAEALTR